MTCENPVYANHGPQVGEHVSETLDGVWLTVTVFAKAQLPTRWGVFDVCVVHNSLDAKEHVLLLKGEGFKGAQGVPVRLHSECLTGDVFASLRCDCREQLELALQLLSQSERGVLLYMRQEGRGIGLGQKIRAYTLQEQGFDTYQANQHLGFDDDIRDYRVAALMLKLLGVASVQLATNNPRKVEALQGYGVTVSQRIPSLVVPNPHNTHYLHTKARKSGHWIP